MATTVVAIRSSELAPTNHTDVTTIRTNNPRTIVSYGHPGALAPEEALQID